MAEFGHHWASTTAPCRARDGNPVRAGGGRFGPSSLPCWLLSPSFPFRCCAQPQKRWLGPLALDLWACKGCQRSQPRSRREPQLQEVCSFGPHLENASQTGAQVPLPWITRNTVPPGKLYSLLQGQDSAHRSDRAFHKTSHPSPPPTPQTTLGHSSSVATQSSLLPPTLHIAPGPREGVPIPVSECPG